MVGGDQVHAHGRQASAAQALDHGLERHAHGQAGRSRAQRVDHLVAAGHGQAHIGHTPGRAQLERRVQVVVEGHVGGTHLAGLLTEGEHLGGRGRRHGHHPRVVGVEHGGARRRQRGHQLGLAVGHVVQGPERLQVHPRHHGDDTDGGATDLAQVTDVAQASSAHLQDGALGVVRRVEERERHAQLVVERPDARRGSRRWWLATDGQQVLERRLADAAGDAHHRIGQAVPGGRTERA